MTFYGGIQVMKCSSRTLSSIGLALLTCSLIFLSADAQRRGGRRGRRHHGSSFAGGFVGGLAGGMVAGAARGGDSSRAEYEAVRAQEQVEQMRREQERERHSYINEGKKGKE